MIIVKILISLKLIAWTGLSLLLYAEPLNAIMSSSVKRKRQSSGSSTLTTEVEHSVQTYRITKTTTNTSVVEEVNPTPRKSRRLSSASVPVEQLATPAKTQRSETPSRYMDIVNVIFFHIFKIFRSYTLLKTCFRSAMAVRRNATPPAKKEGVRSRTPRTRAAFPQESAEEFKSVTPSRRRSDESSSSTITRSTPSRRKSIGNEPSIPVKVELPAPRARVVRLQRKNRGSLPLVDHNDDSSASSVTSMKSTIFLNDFLDDLPDVPKPLPISQSIDVRNRETIEGSALNVNTNNVSAENEFSDKMLSQGRHADMEPQSGSQDNEKGILKYYGLLALVLFLLFYVESIFHNTHFTGYQNIVSTSTNVAQRQNHIMSVYNEKLLLFEQLQSSAVQQVVFDRDEVPKPLITRPKSIVPLCNVLYDDEIHILERYYENSVSKQYENRTCLENCTANDNIGYSIERIGMLRDILTTCTSTDPVKNASLHESMQSDKVLLDLFKIVYEDMSVSNHI